MLEIEIGDIVSTNHGFKMVVDKYPSHDYNETCLACIDCDDNPEIGDVWMAPSMYFKSSVVPVFRTENGC